VLVEIGGIAPTRGLYVMESQIDELGPTVGRWVTESGHTVRHTAREGRPQWANR
jgi:hypothetical protein